MGEPVSIQYSAQILNLPKAYVELSSGVMCITLVDDE